MGFSEGNNPSVSGLNVGSQGIKMNGSGISNCYSVSNGGALYLASTGGTVHIGHSSSGSGMPIEVALDRTYFNGNVRFESGYLVSVKCNSGYGILATLFDQAVSHG